MTPTNSELKDSAGELKSDLTKILAAADEMIAAREKATPGRRNAYWNQGIDRYEVYGGITGFEAIARFAHSGARPDTITLSKADAEFDALAANHAARQAEALKVLAEAMTVYADLRTWQVRGGPEWEYIDGNFVGGKAARRALAKAAAILDGSADGE